MKLSDLLAPLIVLAPLAGQTPAFPGPATKWHTYDRFDFSVDGRPCRVVAPKVRAPNNPWVWRARFPDYHTELDRALLAEGYHIVFLDTNEMLGSPRALAHWDKLYADMRARGMAEQVVLEGVSRGGLFVYRWAAKNPTKVACIYADTPVCDIRSWPLGRGTGLGHKPTWQALLAEFGMTEAEALSFSGNPTDLVAPLAAAGNPILHIVSEDDRIVPAAENTYVLRDRLRSAGGDMEVISVPTGTPKSHGHHFPITDAHLRKTTQFVLRHSNATPGDAQFHRMRGGLSNSRSRLAANDAVTHRVAFLGGSITHNPGWRDLVAMDLRRRFPKSDLQFINAGIPSMGSTPGAFRFERDVLAHGLIDLLFVEAAVNDSTNGRSTTEQLRGMEGIVRHALRVNPRLDIVILHFVDPAKMRTLRAGGTPTVIATHERVADHYGISSLDLAREVTARIDAGEFTWRGDFRNLHPSPFGQLLYYRAIRRLLDAAWSVEEVESAERSLPQPIESNCYARGHLVDLAEAELGEGFERIERWHPDDGKGTRKGFVNVPMLVATRPGAQLALRFEGDAAGIFVAAGPDAGAIEWSVDGGTFERRDLLTRWSRGLHLPWAHVLATHLGAGPHVLTLRVAAPAGEDRGSAVRIAHFLVNGEN